MNRDGDLCRAGQATGIAHRIRKDIRQRVARGAKGLNCRVGVVDCIRISTGRRDVDRTVGTRHCGSHIGGSRTHNTGSDTAHGLGITRIDIGIIGQHVTGRVCTGGTIGRSTCFDSGGCIHHCGWCIVGTLNGDRDLGRARYTQRIIHGVRKHISDGGSTRTECLYCRIGVIDGIGISTVGCNRDGTKGTHNASAYVSCCADLGSGQDTDNRLCFTVSHRIDVGVIGEHVTGWVRSRRSVRKSASFDCGGRVEHCRRCIIRTLDSDGYLSSRLSSRIIGNRIAENIIKPIGGSSKCLNSAIAIIDRVTVTAIGLYNECAVGSRDIGIHRAIDHGNGTRGNSSNGNAVASVGVGVVSEQVSGRIGSEGPVIDAARFDCRCRIAHGNRSIVYSTNCDGDLSCRLQPTGVGHGVAEYIIKPLDARTQLLNLYIGIVNSV